MADGLNFQINYDVSYGSAIREIEAIKSAINRLNLAAKNSKAAVRNMFSSLPVGSLINSINILEKRLVRLGKTPIKVHQSFSSLGKAFNATGVISTLNNINNRVKAIIRSSLIAKNALRNLGGSGRGLPSPSNYSKRRQFGYWC